MTHENLLLCRNIIPCSRHRRAPIVNCSVPIFTQNPQTYLLLGHILSVAGYTPSLMKLDSLTCSKNAAIPFAVLFDTAEDTEPILELCAKIKHNPATKNIILIALLPPCNTRDFLRFLQAGIDECFANPFAPERILSFLQNRYPLSIDRTYPHPLQRNEIHVGNLDILADKRILRYGEAEIQLTPIEFRILQGLIDAPGHVLNREQIIKVGWPPHHYVQRRTVDVHVGNLRRHLRKLTGKNLIRTVHTTGYAFEYSH